MCELYILIGVFSPRKCIQMWHFRQQILKNFQNVFVEDRLLYCYCHQVIERKEETRWNWDHNKDLNYHYCYSSNFLCLEVHLYVWVCLCVRVSVCMRLLHMSKSARVYQAATPFATQVKTFLSEPQLYFPLLWHRDKGFVIYISSERSRG